MIRTGIQFQNDSPLGEMLEKILNLCGLSLLWLLFCVPIVTAGAATCALHVSVRKVKEKEDGVFAGFFRSFRKNFRQGTMLWVLILFLGLCLALCFRIASCLAGGVAAPIKAALFIPVLFLLMMTVYAFPLLARFETASLGTLIVNAVMLGIAYFPKTLLLIGLNVLPVLLICWLPSILACVLFIWVPVGFSLTALLTENSMEPVFAVLENLERDNV